MGGEGHGEGDHGGTADQDWVSGLGAALWRAGATTQDRQLTRTYTFHGTLALRYIGFVATAILLAARLGWTLAGLIGGLIILCAWTDLRLGVRRARVVRG